MNTMSGTKRLGLCINMECREVCRYDRIGGFMRLMNWSGRTVWAPYKMMENAARACMAAMI